MPADYDLDLFMSNLVSEDIIQSATLGMAYYTNASGNNSTLYFGGLNPAYANSTNQLTWTSLYSATSQWWQVPISAILVGGISISIVANNGIVDSGTSLILMTFNDYQNW